MRTSIPQKLYFRSVLKNGRTSVMKFKVILYLLPLILVVIGFTSTEQERPTTGYWAMKGTLIVHPLPDSLESLSDQKIYELQDKNGLTIWFCRYFFKDVCMTGKCKMIHLWIFWDGAGDYLGIQLPKGEPLTKSDHTEFKAADYEKLDKILHDKVSILKNLKTKDLTYETEPLKKNVVDAISSATQPALIDLVVRGAIYTCHTLWHTVYGHTNSEINRLLLQKTDKKYLATLFETGNTPHLLWAIRFVENHPAYHTDFYPAVIKLVKSDQTQVAEAALEYFNPDHLKENEEQRTLASILPDVSYQMRYQIVWKLTACNKLSIEVIFTITGTSGKSGDRDWSTPTGIYND